LSQQKKWPCYFFDSDTTGEKDFEEFFTSSEKLDLDRFESIGVIKNDPTFDEKLLKHFENEISAMKLRGRWSKEEIVQLFNTMIPDFGHKETGKYLDGRM
jgi:UDP-N-acetylglucosamine 4,6-dehydratase